MEEIIKEKISADHLLYVSLKYTKTCDVIYNLLLRWRNLIETSINHILEHAKDKGKIKSVPKSPLERLEVVRKIFKKDKHFQKVMDFYEMLRKLENLRQERSGEFRKNVNLRIFYQGKEINVNLDKLKEYADDMEKFMEITKKFLQS